ncbi:MAG: hypothetical protein Fur0042_13220 [Cyanophyceae cyanobacterium]
MGDHKKSRYFFTDSKRFGLQKRLGWGGAIATSPNKITLRFEFPPRDGLEAWFSGFGPEPFGLFEQFEGVAGVAGAADVAEFEFL